MFVAVQQYMDAVKIIIHLKELQITVERSVIAQSLTNKYALRLTKFYPRSVYDERTNKIPKTIILKLKSDIESQYDVCPKAFLVHMNYGDLSDIILSISV